MPAGGQQFVEMAAEEQPPPTPQAAPVRPEVPPVVRQQTPVAAAAPEDRMALLERFLRLRPPTFSGDRDPNIAESWVHELERTFETMDCAELDQVRRLDQINWAEFLVAFHGEFLLDYVCRERRDMFHELVQGDLIVGQYHISGESYGPGEGVSVLDASEWGPREVFSVTAPFGQSRECFLLFFFRDRRCCPDLEVEEAIRSWRQTSVQTAAVTTSVGATASGAVGAAESRVEPTGLRLLPLWAARSLHARVSVEAAAAGTSDSVPSTPASTAPAAALGSVPVAAAAAPATDRQLSIHHLASAVPPHRTNRARTQPSIAPGPAGLTSASSRSGHRPHLSQLHLASTPTAFKTPSAAHQSFTPPASFTQETPNLLPDASFALLGKKTDFKWN
ncbi:hypothetical protein Taro_039195, partial [Colocasia esculenta]|nr:hypothetical protein [Colocasia esculenta]